MKGADSGYMLKPGHLVQVNRGRSLREFRWVVRGNIVLFSNNQRFMENAQIHHSDLFWPSILVIYASFG